MKKHTHAIRNLRQSLAELTNQKRQVKGQIQALKLDAAGKRRPETGPERSRLWMDYVWATRPHARAIHLALGMLQGTPYSAMEPRCAKDNPPPTYGIFKAIQAACGEDEALKAEWTLERIQAHIDGKQPTVQEAA